MRTQCWKQGGSGKNSYASNNNDEDKGYLRGLIERRKVSKAADDRLDVVRASKLIQKEIKRLNRITKTAKVIRILEQFKELGQLADIRKKGKKDCINSVINKDGKECKNKEEIADAFADFYEELYAKEEAYDYCLSSEVKEVEAVTPKEVRKQLILMKKNKAADETGVVAELLREGGDDLMEHLANIFTEVLKPGADVPTSWCSSAIKVLYKKGNPKDPANYCPVCIIPILYKLFSRIICERIKGILLSEQADDQAGFRPGFGCEDHLFTMTIIAEKCAEFNIPLWVAAIDFSKAFDSINHRSIFEALEAHNVPMAYINALSRLYKEQRASVRCESQSRMFDICRGTKQGDPISPFIFNAVLEQVLRAVKAKWKTRRYGLELEPNVQERLTNLRFADDILLVSRTLPQGKQMLEDLMVEYKKVGLSLHPEKSKIMDNDRGYGSKVTKAKINGAEIEVLSGEASTMYLGRLLSLSNTHEVELSHRIRKAWTKFGIYKEELTNKAVPLRLRLKLFNATVTPTVLYGAGCWVLTKSREQELQGAQMKMIRSILGHTREKDEKGVVESWVTWVKRSTKLAREKMTCAKMATWAEEACSRQRKWATKMLMKNEDSWTKKAYYWIPIGFRSVGRPAKRWTADEEEE